MQNAATSIFYNKFIFPAVRKNLFANELHFIRAIKINLDFYIHFMEENNFHVLKCQLKIAFENVTGRPMPIIQFLYFWMKKCRIFFPFRIN